MNAAERRTKITHLLAQANGPLSATALAAQCGVSRQIIVGDVALLRAGGLAVLATPRGYILENTSAPACAERHIVSHHDNSRMLEELYTVVDLGGAVIDVTVEHAVYVRSVHRCTFSRGMTPTRLTRRFSSPAPGRCPT